jgi:hypothetical protein
MDSVSDDYHDRSVPVIMALLGVDEQAAIYIGRSRATKNMRHRDRVTVHDLTATWLDGYVAGALYNAQQHTLTPPRKDDAR